MLINTNFCLKESLKNTVKLRIYKLALRTYKVATWNIFFCKICKDRGFPLSLVDTFQVCQNIHTIILHNTNKVHISYKFGHTYICFRVTLIWFTGLMSKELYNGKFFADLEFAVSLICRSDEKFWLFLIKWWVLLQHLNENEGMILSPSFFLSYVPWMIKTSKLG